MQSGTLHVKTTHQNYQLGPGEYGILRKFSEGTMHKSFATTETEANMYTFMLTNEFVERLVKELVFPGKVPPFTEEWLPIQATAELNDLVEEVISSVTKETELDPARVVDQTFKVLKALLRADPNVAMVFREYASNEAADLLTYMNYNFMYNIPLELFAKQSGRSLSTFNREFRRIFKDTPRRWLMKRRLKYAWEQITAGEKPSDIYLRSGFEDLGHFSRAFKREFGVVPSAINPMA